jgi:hypothetical protein
MKVEIDSDDEELYAAPQQSGQASSSSRQAPSNNAARASSVEAIEPVPHAWNPDTTSNQEIYDSSHPDRKFYTHELIKHLKPFLIADAKLPWKTFRQVFTRPFLSRHLGGSPQQCIVRVGKDKQKGAASKPKQIYPIQQYRCEGPKWNPFLPKAPGLHGVVYWFNENVLTLNELVTVFCRRARNQWEYCGEYLITVRQLEPGEWEKVPALAKESWYVCA